MYIEQLKIDLKIGTDGFPKKVVLVGDEQTYSIIMKLKEDNKSRYEWVYPMPGDWHIIKLVAEQLRDIMWDGGLKQFAVKCGHKANTTITQWQDLNLILLATYEALMRKALVEFIAINKDPSIHHHGKAFWQWVQKQCSRSNTDKLSQFWAQILVYLNAYTAYLFAIRSGNWNLRNSCLKKITELMFAYSHNKYEHLCITSIVSSQTCPESFLKHFNNGEWTCSLRARPYHNLAVDESHECVINNRIKNVTSRPSYFRTVELANFVAYADKVVSGVGNYLDQDSDYTQIKRHVCERATVISEMIEKTALFKHEEPPRALANIFNPKAKDLKGYQCCDLEAITDTGKERMSQYCQKYILDKVPIKSYKKSKKLATFTPRAVTLREHNNIVKQLEEINCNALQALKCSGNAIQTSPYPLALARLDGTMRTGCKSTFKSALETVDHFHACFENTSPVLGNNSCVILDFMCYVHMPPPNSTRTYSEYFNYLWSISVSKYIGVASQIVFTIDKPEHLPPPRKILHKHRAKGKQINIDCGNIDDNSLIPHNNTYASLLSSPEEKRKVIEYLTMKLVEACIHYSQNGFTSFIVDSPALSVTNHIARGALIRGEINEHGEGDLAVWHHCINLLNWKLLT